MTGSVTQLPLNKVTAYRQASDKATLTGWSWPADNSPQHTATDCYDTPLSQPWGLMYGTQTAFVVDLYSYSSEDNSEDYSKDYSEENSEFYSNCLCADCWLVPSEAGLRQ